MPKSTQARAAANPATHSFRIGLGYMEHPTILKPGPFRGLCMPAAGAVSDSQHILVSPHGATKVFAWVAKHLAWHNPVPSKGHRMAFTAAYLGSHGWTYQGPYVPAQIEAA